MKWKIVLSIMLVMLLVGCSQLSKPTPEDTIQKYGKYLEYGEYELIYDEILDIGSKSTSPETNELLKKIYLELTEEGVGSYNNLQTECEEISNDGKNAKLYCNHKYKNMYGTEMEESVKYNLIKEDDGWKIII